jgi:hypothetical protein
MTRTEVIKTLKFETGGALSIALAEMDSNGVKYFISEGGRELSTQLLYALQGRLGKIPFTDLQWACQKLGVRPPANGGTITDTLRSAHIEGNAVDIVPLKIKKDKQDNEVKDDKGNLVWEVDWNNQDERIVSAMKNAGFIWGGDWKEFIDKPHFEYRR